MRNKGWIIPVLIFAGSLIYGIVEVTQMGSGAFFMPIGIVGLSFTLVWYVFVRHIFTHRRLMKHGEPGSARVLTVSETGVTVNNNPMVKLELEVTPQRGSTYVTTTRVIVSRLNPMMYAPGTEVKVKIDPKDQMNVVVDKEATASGYTSGYSGGSMGGAGMAQVNTQRNAAMTELLMAADKIRVEVLDSSTSEDAEGTILSLWSLDVNVNNMASGIEFLVEVDIPGKAPFKTEIKGVVANTNLAKYHIGARVKLKYDPVDPRNRITIAGVV